MNIGIVGAGITGLTAAYELGKKGHQVTLFEAQPVAGGLSSGFDVPEWNWTLDRFYRHIFAGDQEIIALAKELHSPLIFTRPKTSMWVNGRPYVYDNPVGVALYPNLPLFTNLRIGIVVAYLKYLVRDGTKLDGITAHQWAHKAMGERAYREVWEPMLRGKFKDAYDKVSMAWLWARFAARTPRLGYFEGGFQVFIDRLADAVRRQGSDLQLGVTVDQILSQGDRIELVLGGGKSTAFDRVLTTTSPHALRRMVPALPDAYRESLADLKSTGAVVLILALVDSILTDGTYWLNLPEGEFPCLSMVEHTNYQDKAHYDGNTIVYLGDYLPLDAPQMQMDTDELYAHWSQALAKVRPEFDDSWVRGKWSFRETYAQPVPQVNHAQRVPALETPVSHLYWACMHHVYPWDRGTNYAVELGQRAAGLIAR